MLRLETLVHFTRLVSDSPTSEGVSILLAQTVVERCGAIHALVCGTDDNGNYGVLASYGACTTESKALELSGVDSISELRGVVMRACEGKGYGLRTFPMISNAGFFGVLVALYEEAHPLTAEQWVPIEALTELTAISLSKTYQHQRLQQAFDDLRASQAMLLRTERFRALGQMSAGIAHDLKNLLNPLQLYTDHIRDMAGNPKEVLDTIDRMDRVLTRGLETVERLRDFSRQSSEQGESTPTNLDDMAREAIEICKPKLATMKPTLQLGAPPAVLIRPADCVTAIVNLVLNAADAVAEKGNIAIRTGMSDGGSWVEVADDGPGILPEIRNRIIEPLFTTKGDRGTGLGVSTVFAFTQRHGGRLDIESEPGHGAKFRMWFPSAQGQAPDIQS